MQLSFLGDALDHWKGFLFESLQSEGVLRRFAVDPMASDPAIWTSEDIALYAKLLRLQSTQVIRHTASLNEDRQTYFQEIKSRHLGDLFVDPDTGVATGSVKEPRRYIMPNEIAGLLLSVPDRLLLIYQHVRGGVAARVDSVLAAIQLETGTLGWSSYESGTVAMIFICLKQERTATVARHFRELLGFHARGRIRD